MMKFLRASPADWQWRVSMGIAYWALLNYASLEVIAWVTGAQISFGVVAFMIASALQSSRRFTP